MTFHAAVACPAGPGLRLRHAQHPLTPQIMAEPGFGGGGEEGGADVTQSISAGFLHPFSHYDGPHRWSEQSWSSVKVMKQEDALPIKHGGAEETVSMTLKWPKISTLG